MQRSLYLAAYDIRDPRRLRHALAAVKHYASGGQKSAHECWLSSGDIRNLVAAMQQLMDHDEDRFALLALDPRRATMTLGRALDPVDPEFRYFG